MCSQDGVDIAASALIVVWIWEVLWATTRGTLLSKRDRQGGCACCLWEGSFDKKHRHVLDDGWTCGLALLFHCYSCATGTWHQLLLHCEQVFHRLHVVSWVLGSFSRGEFPNGSRFGNLSFMLALFLKYKEFLLEWPYATQSRSNLLISANLNVDAEAKGWYARNRSGKEGPSL